MCAEHLMFTLLSVRNGLKTIEQDLNPLTHLSTLYVCHIFFNNYYYLFYEMSRSPIGLRNSVILSSETPVSSLCATGKMSIAQKIRRPFKMIFKHFRNVILHILIFTLISTFFYMVQCAGLGGSVGCAVRLETRRSRVQPPPRSATFFRGDWSWNIFYGHSLPSADSKRAVVSFWRKNVHNTG